MIMPAYHYQCTYCQVTETRIAGLDDHLAVCARCQHLMIRLDHDLFGPYFDKFTIRAQPVKVSENLSGVEDTRLRKEKW